MARPLAGGGLWGAQVDHGNPYRNINDEGEARHEGAAPGLDSLQLALGLDPSASCGPQSVRQTVQQPPPDLDPSESNRRSPAHLALFRSGNPYATHYYFPEGELDASLATSNSGSESAHSPATTGLSQEAFRRLCTAIFRGYIPKLEQGRLRAHHREFIARNESRSPSIRRALISELQKYNLASIPGLVPQFNREDDVFTEAKLRTIEEAVRRLNGD